MKAKLILVACLLLLTAVAIWRIPSRSEKDANASLAANSVNSNSSSPPAGTNFSSGAKVHPRLASIFAKPDERPELSVLAALRPEDEPALLREYQQKTNFYQRIASMWALGFVGGDATVPVFKHALTDEFKGRPLALGMPGKTRDEFEAMIDTVWALAMRVGNC